MELKPKLNIECKPNHRYEVNGFPAPSVSEICEPLTKRFYSDNPEPALFGQAVHSAIHYALEGDLEESSINEEVMGCVRAAQKFIDDFSLTPVLIEKPVAMIHPMLFAGRIDVALANGKGIYLPDWKTGVSDKSFMVRLAAYDLAFRATYGERPIKRMAVYVSPDGTYKTEEFIDPLDFTVFKGLHAIWSWKRINERRF